MDSGEKRLKRSGLKRRTGRDEAESGDRMRAGGIRGAREARRVAMAMEFLAVWQLHRLLCLRFITLEMNFIHMERPEP